MKPNIRFNNPWAMGVQGLVLLILGIAAIVNSEMTLITVTRFFGMLLLISGILVAVLAKLETENFSQFWFYEGITNLILGMILIIFPKAVAGFFIVLLGIFILVIGILNLWLVLNNKPDFIILRLIRNSILILFGLLFLFVPFNGAIMVIKLIGFIALIYGSITLFIAFKLLKN